VFKAHWTTFINDMLENTRCLVLLTSKKWRLQREGRQSRRNSIEMKSDWLFVSRDRTIG